MFCFFQKFKKERQKERKRKIKIKRKERERIRKRKLSISNKNQLEKNQKSKIKNRTRANLHSQDGQGQSTGKKMENYSNIKNNSRRLHVTESLINFYSHLAHHRSRYSCTERNISYVIWTLGASRALSSRHRTDYRRTIQRPAVRLRSDESLVCLHLSASLETKSTCYLTVKCETKSSFSFFHWPNPRLFFFLVFWVLFWIPILSHGNRFPTTRKQHLTTQFNADNVSAMLPTFLQS